MVDFSYKHFSVEVARKPFKLGLVALISIRAIKLATNLKLDSKQQCISLDEPSLSIQLWVNVA